MTEMGGKRTGALAWVWEKCREHATNAAIGGGVLVLTGFTPEHWVAEVFHRLHLSRMASFWPAYLDGRMLVLGSGAAIIVADVLWRHHRNDKAVLAAAGTAERAPIEPDAVATSGGAGDGEMPALPDQPSIAVLPFQNMSDDAGQEYFADGMVEDIISGLSRIKWLFVIARNSSFTYKHRAVDVKRIARELGVRYVLEGSVRKANRTFRVTAQLIDAASGSHIWAEHYDRVVDDVFAVQDDIALSVMGAIEPSLRMAEAERVKRKRPDSLAAYDLCLQAQADVYSVMPNEVNKALILVRRAIARDPDYGLAHAYAGMCHHSLYLRNGFHPEDRAASVRYGETAIAKGADDALALTLGGFCLGMDKHDRPAAIAAFETALATSPSSAATYIFGGVVLSWSGDADRAIEWSERGLRLSPFDPWRFSALLSLSRGRFQRGQFEQAAGSARKAVQFNPGFSMCHILLAAALVKLDRIDEAKSAAARALELQPTFRISRQFDGVGCAAILAAPLGEALRAAGLPE